MFKFKKTILFFFATTSLCALEVDPTLDMVETNKAAHFYLKVDGPLPLLGVGVRTKGSNIPLGVDLSCSGLPFAGVGIFRGLCIAYPGEKELFYIGGGIGLVSLNWNPDHYLAVTPEFVAGWQFENSNMFLQLHTSSIYPSLALGYRF